MFILKQQVLIKLNFNASRRYHHKIVEPETYALRNSFLMTNFIQCTLTVAKYQLSSHS